MRKGLLPEWDGDVHRTNPLAGRELLWKEVRAEGKREECISNLKIC
jgi:hypothetical protein